MGGANKTWKSGVAYTSGELTPQAKLVLLATEHRGMNPEQISAVMKSRYRLTRVSYVSSMFLFGIAPGTMFPPLLAITLPMSLLYAYYGLLQIHLNRSMLPKVSTVYFDQTTGVTSLLISPLDSGVATFLHVPHRAANVYYSRDIASQITSRTNPIPNADERFGHTKTALSDLTTLMFDYPKSMCLRVKCDLKLGDGYFKDRPEVSKMHKEAESIIIVCWATNYSIFKTYGEFTTKTDFGREFIKGEAIDDSSMPHQ